MRKFRKKKTLLHDRLGLISDNLLIYGVVEKIEKFLKRKRKKSLQM